MKTAAIYGRYSSDKQNGRSVDDQIAYCRELAQRAGFVVVKVFEDRAVSGASIINRHGFASLMKAAERKDFQVIIVEDVDRLARDQADFHTARKKLDFLGIAIHTAAGAVSRIDGSLRALMGEMFLENLGLHTRVAVWKAPSAAVGLQAAERMDIVL